MNVETSGSGFFPALISTAAGRIRTIFIACIQLRDAIPPQASLRSRVPTSGLWLESAGARARRISRQSQKKPESKVKAGGGERDLGAFWIKSKEVWSEVPPRAIGSPLALERCGLVMRGNGPCGLPQVCSARA